VSRSFICETPFVSCLLTSIRQITLYRDDAGTDWPVPTANIATLGRQLKSSKGELQYHLSDSASLQAAIKEPLPDDENLDAGEVFIKDLRQQTQGITQPGQSPAAAPQQLAPELGNIVVSQAGGQYPGDYAVPQVYQKRGNVLQPSPPQQVNLIRAGMAEDSVLLPSTGKHLIRTPGNFGVQKHWTTRSTKIGDGNACRKCAGLGGEIGRRS